MKAFLVFLLAGGAAPAIAQHSGHTTPTAPAPSGTCTPEHAAAGHCTLPAPAQPADPHAGHAMPATQQPPTPAPAPASNCTPEHAAAGHCTLPDPTPPAPDPHAGHAMPTTQQQPAPSSSCTPEHAAMGHCTRPADAQPADPHAGHGVAGSPGAPPVAPPPPEALQGPANAADLYWDRASMAKSREELLREHGDIPAYRILIDQAEARIRGGRDGYFLNGEAWYGGDIDKAWFKTEVEGDFGSSPEQAELQALWSHAVDPWFDLQTGIRYDAAPDSKTAHLVVGVQGLAPYWIEIDAAAFLSTRGDLTARFEAEHDVRITQKLILQPRAELDFALQDIPRESLGAGLSTAELGLRLRYQITQQFAPYIGVEYDRAFGGTRKFRRQEGEDLGGFSFVTGVRFWF